MKHSIIIALTVILTACSTGKESEHRHDDNALHEDHSTEQIENGTMNMDTIRLVATGQTMAEMSFALKEIHVPANKTITIELVNESTDPSMPHNFVVIEDGTANEVGQNGIRHKDNAYVNPGDLNVIAHSPLVQAKNSIYFTFTTPEKGIYQFICSYPGHWGMMQGDFIVE